MSLGHIKTSHLKHLITFDHQLIPAEGALMPHSEKVPGPFLVWCACSPPGLRGFSPGTPVTSKRMLRLITHRGECECVARPSRGPCDELVGPGRSPADSRDRPVTGATGDDE